MNTFKEKMMLIGEQAIDDLKILENAKLDDMEKMPTWNIIDSLRFLQRICDKTNLSVHDITPELIIKELDKPKTIFK